MNQKIQTIIKSVFLLALVVISIQALAQWQAPTGTAPTNNAYPPINVGPNDQVKVGGGIFAKVLGANKGYFLCGQFLGATIPCLPGSIFSAARGFSFGPVGITVDDTGALIIYDGSNTNTDGKVLTSDPSGKATWQDPSGLPPGSPNQTLYYDNATNQWKASDNITNTAGIGIVQIGGTPSNTLTNLNTKLMINGGIKIVDGTQANGYVLTSDANGTATWKPSNGVPNGTMQGQLLGWNVPSSSWIVQTQADGLNNYTLRYDTAIGQWRKTGALQVNGSNVVTVSGKLKIVDGTQADNRVLTSSVDGTASWEDLSTLVSSNYYTKVSGVDIYAAQGPTGWIKTDGLIVENNAGPNKIATSDAAGRLIWKDPVSVYIISDIACDNLGFLTTSPTCGGKLVSAGQYRACGQPVATQNYSETCSNTLAGRMVTP